MIRVSSVWNPSTRITKKDVYDEKDNRFAAGPFAGAALLGLAQATDAPAPALVAEPYVSPEGGFKISYPEGYLLISRGSIDRVFEQIKEGTLPFEGFDMSQIDGFIKTLEQIDILMFAYPLAGRNFNVLYEVVPQYNQHQTQDLVADLDSLHAMYQGMFSDYQPGSPATLVTFGGQDFARLEGSYVLNGQSTMLVQLYTLVKDTMYTISYTLVAKDRALTPVDEALITATAGSFIGEGAKAK